MMKRARIFILSLLLPLPAAAQNYGAHMIDEQLARGANAVVREDVMEYEYRNKTSATGKHTVVITVLDESGDDAARIATFTSKNRSLKSFSGEIYDRSGTLLRKIRRSDLKSSEYSDGLADDTKIYYYTPHVPNYPYTVKYTYEITHNDGILCFPTFAPVPGTNVSVEKASYTLVMPAGATVHIKNVNTEIRPEKGGKGSQDVYTWSVAGLKPMTAEPYGRRFRDAVPMVYITPHEFSYNGIVGVMDSWESYAEWQWKLLKGRQELPAALKQEIARMTAEAGSDIGKIRALYDYLAATTRYVSIQIGIGGLQPMTAVDVYNRKFGDCKGLSNYMRAMLAECGIASYYVEIGVNGRDIIPDYANPLLSNHAILAVPQEGGGMLWLECTAPELPMGYVHPGIAGQHALVYKDGGAYIERVPVYADSLSLSRIEGSVTVAADGSLTGSAAKTDACNRYDELRGFGKMDGRERLNFLQKQMNLPAAKLSGISYSEQKDAIPYCTTTFEAAAAKQAETAPGRLFLETSPFRKTPVQNMGRSKRKTDIVIDEGYRNTDSISFAFDDSYEIEALPAPQSVECKYGIFRQAAIPVDGKIVVERVFQINTGEYPSEEYDGFKQFVEAVQAGYSSKIVLRKKQ